MTTREKVEKLLDRLSDAELEAEYARLQVAMEDTGERQPPFSLIGAFHSGQGDLSERASSDEFERGDAYESQPSR